MQRLTYEGRELLYEKKVDDGFMGTDMNFTNFYSATEKTVKKYRKYLFFGKTIIVAKPKFLFRLNINIESPHRSKEELRAMIGDALAVIDREDEIKRGILI